MERLGLFHFSGSLSLSLIPAGQAYCPPLTLYTPTPKLTRALQVKQIASTRWGKVAAGVLAAVVLKGPALAILARVPLLGLLVPRGGGGRGGGGGGGAEAAFEGRYGGDWEGGGGRR